MTVPHPILASEDDEEYVIRTILALPDLVEEFFECLEAVFIEGQPQTTRANVLFLNIQRQLRIIDEIPPSSFRTTDEITGKTKRNIDLPKMIVRLNRLFLEDVITVSAQALSWKRPCLQLAQDCADHMQGGRLHFPRALKLRRQLVTFKSSLFLFVCIFFCAVVIFASVLVIVLPAVQPRLSVGVPLGAVAAGLLVLMSGVLLAHFIYASRSLYLLYNNLFEEALLLGTEAGRVQNDGDGNVIPMQMTGLDRQRLLGNRSVKVTKGRHTKKGYYSIPYGSDIGYIDGRHLDSQVVMIAFDKEFLITRWNNAAEVMTGFLEDGCIGKPISELVSSPNGGDICDVLKKSRKNELIKIKLRALAMAPTTLYTIVAPIGNPDGDKVGSILICANAKDNLRDYRNYMHNYQACEAKSVLTRILDRGTVPHEDAMLIRALQLFASNSVANRVEELAREMVTDWEWTNVERLLGRALGSALSSHEVVVDPMFPQTLCISPLMPTTLGMIVSLAGGHCAIRLNILNPMGNIFTLCVTVALDARSRPWDEDKVEESLIPMLRNTAGNLCVQEEEIQLRFPCQVAAILEDTAESDAHTSDQAQKLTQARAIINCTVNVVTAVKNMVDQHNLSLLLLKTMFVSLASVREYQDLEQRLSPPCDVDVVMCDSEWLSECRDLLLSGDHGAIIIPVVDTNAPLMQDFEYVIRLPLVGRDVQETMVEVGKNVSKKKNAITAREERERILTLRQDSPWTKGKLLGRGSYGAVYEATSDLTGGKMAVKMFYFGADRESSINQLLNEIQIMCSLNHPNIVHYFHCERKDNDVNLFMELCLASLTDLIIGRREKPPTLTPLSIIRQVLTAIAYLHSRGIVHRDIKPQNILLKDDSGLIKLSDFGTARQGDATKEVRGTFRYMAPEVYKGEPHSLPCDVWSVGCLVCELFACPPKFMDNAALLGDVSSASVAEYIEDTPNNPMMRDFLNKCFRLDPMQRPSSDNLLTHPMLSANAIAAEIDKLPTVFDAQRNVKERLTNQSAFSISSN